MTKEGDVSFQGITGSLGVGTPGGSVGVGGAQATNAILLSGRDFETIVDGDWDKKGVVAAQSWNRALNSDDMSNPSGFWEYTGKEMTFSRVEGKGNTYSVNVSLHYSYKTTGKGAAAGQKDMQITQENKTGIEISKTNEYTYESNNLKK